MPDERDPREEPRRGDVVKVGTQEFTVLCYEFTLDGHAFVVADRKDRARLEVYVLAEWKAMMAQPDAEVIHAQP